MNSDISVSSPDHSILVVIWFMAGKNQKLRRCTCYTNARYKLTMKADNLSILVLGAGELGTFVINSLAKHAARRTAHVTVLLRESTINTKDESKRKQLESFKSLNVALLAGDTETEAEDELSHKFRRFDTVIVCTGMYSPPGTQLKFARAAVAAKVKRYLPWQYGLDYDVIGRDSAQDLFTEQLNVRDLLRGQHEIAWVIISTGVFMSFLFEDFFGIVSADLRTVRALGSWENTVTVTDAEDIGKMVAEVALVEQDLTDVVYIAGDTVSYAQLAKLLDDTNPEIVQKELWSIEKLQQDLIQDPSDTIRKYRIVFAQGRGTAWDKKKTLNYARDIQLRDIRTWLSERRP
jgi:Fe-S cluster biosynthesis and repair protein YggX